MNSSPHSTILSAKLFQRGHYNYGDFSDMEAWTFCWVNGTVIGLFQSHGYDAFSLYGISVFIWFSRHSNSNRQRVFLTCLLKMKIYAVVISLSKAHHQNHTSKVYCLRLKHQGNPEEARPCGHPFRLHAEGNRFIIRNDFLRDKAIDVGKVLIVEPSSNGCRYLSNTGHHLVRL